MTFSEIRKNHVRINIEQPETARASSETVNSEYVTIQIPSGRATRAETWLTVYRSLYMRMLSQLVADFRGERLSVNFDAKFLMMRTFIEK